MTPYQDPFFTDEDPEKVKNTMSQFTTSYKHDMNGIETLKGHGLLKKGTTACKKEGDEKYWDDHKRKPGFQDDHYTTETKAQYGEEKYASRANRLARQSHIMHGGEFLTYDTQLAHEPSKWHAPRYQRRSEMEKEKEEKEKEKPTMPVPEPPEPYKGEPHGLEVTDDHNQKFAHPSSDGTPITSGGSNSNSTPLRNTRYAGSNDNDKQNAMDFKRRNQSSSIF